MRKELSELKNENINLVNSIKRRESAGNQKFLDIEQEESSNERTYSVKNSDFEQKRQPQFKSNNFDNIPLLRWYNLNSEKMVVCRRISHENCIWFLIKYIDFFYWVEHNSIPESKMKLIMMKYSNNFIEEIEPSLMELSIALLQNNEMLRTASFKDIIKELSQLNIENNKMINELKTENYNLKLDKVKNDDDKFLDNKEPIQAQKTSSEQGKLISQSSLTKIGKNPKQIQNNISNLSSENISAKENLLCKQRIIELNNLLKILEQEVN